MRPRTDRRLLLGVPLALMIVGAANPATVPDPVGNRTVVQVHATGVHSDKGQVLVALFASEEGFPNEVDHALQRGIASLEGSEARYSFEPIAAGTYAVSVLHDEDGDLEMKTGFFGQPKEGWAVSRNATGHFGPPSFEDAAFSAEGDSIYIELELRY